MSRIFNRPMFKRGGSAGQGITSGLDRPGYALGDSVDIDEVIRLKEKMRPLYGEPPRGYNTNDFLIDWGLKMASATPQGNVISTGAAAAQEPFGKLTKGKADTEMAEYLSDVKATDQALGAVTDIAVARAKNQNLKDENEARAIGTIMAQVLKENPNPGTFGNSNAELISTARYKVRMLRQTNQDKGDPVVARVIEGETDQGGAWELQNSGVWDYDVTKLSSNIVWLDPLGQEYIVPVDTDNDGLGNGEPKKFKSYEAAKSYLDNVKTLKEEPVDGKKTTTTSKEDTKQTSAEINKEKEDYVYTEEDFQVQSSPDAVERAIKKAESGSTEDYDNITNFWKWMASEKDLNNYFKIKEKKIAKAPPGYN